MATIKANRLYARRKHYQPVRCLSKNCLKKERASLFGVVKALLTVILLFLLVLIVTILLPGLFLINALRLFFVLAFLLEVKIAKSLVN